ncbi:uncharacterized protein BDZ99DRAFT_383436 [Mytilinidion resinicola]|uniref:Hemerythrin-like domain-containing protein n=1 Tax=Mytilinidion resinicola TaxID=574789 RepID=A0A6A6YTJ9_9PEZI|nr:uncharacterized protein BDZ99DRAFT_383436 [Mytilinidion resinicola]KAF2812276.1 hypothetical protein BDZ99DRAFT_383436 [Mytilinidion resinicola]
MAQKVQQPWADGPLKMVTTPMFETKKDDTFTIGASHMAVLHNAMLRGYNSIYLQAPHVKPEDYADFIGYSLTWFKFVKGHHDDEEANLFPKVVEVLGKEDGEIWGKTHGEHEAMLPGLAKFHEYLSSLPSPASFSASTLLSIMKEFEEPFDTHFHSEIASIASLGSYGDFPAAKPVFATWGKNSVKSAGYTDVVPFLFLNFDRTVEDGLWATWPPMPAPIRYMLVRVGGWWHGGWWKFASCDENGIPKTLYALGEKTEGDAKEV